MPANRRDSIRHFRAASQGGSRCSSPRASGYLARPPNPECLPTSTEATGLQHLTSSIRRTGASINGSTDAAFCSSGGRLSYQEAVSDQQASIPLRGRGRRRAVSRRGRRGGGAAHGLVNGQVAHARAGRSMLKSIVLWLLPPFSGVMIFQAMDRDGAPGRLRRARRGRSNTRRSLCRAPSCSLRKLLSADQGLPNDLYAAGWIAIIFLIRTPGPPSGSRWYPRKRCRDHDRRGGRTSRQRSRPGRGAGSPSPVGLITSELDQGADRKWKEACQYDMKSSGRDSSGW